MALLIRNKEIFVYNILKKSVYPFFSLLLLKVIRLGSGNVYRYKNMIPTHNRLPKFESRHQLSECLTGCTGAIGHLKTRVIFKKRGFRDLNISPIMCMQSSPEICEQDIILLNTICTWELHMKEKFNKN